MFHLYALLVFMILGSIIAIETRNLLSSVISIGAVGFALSIIFLFLGAPDIAITQIVVEVICLIILIKATVSTDSTATETYRDTFALVSGLIVFGLFLAFAYAAFRSMPEFGSPPMTVSQHYLDSALAETGAANTVMAIVLDYRALDTLGETTVLFTAILGAFVILRKRGRKRKGEKDPEKVGIREDY